MKTELKIFNELIDTIVKNSSNNEANITNVELWAKSWKEEMSQALAIPIVVKSFYCDENIDGFKKCKEQCRVCRGLEQITPKQ